MNDLFFAIALAALVPGGLIVLLLIWALRHRARSFRDFNARRAAVALDIARGSRQVPPAWRPRSDSSPRTAAVPLPARAPAPARRYSYVAPPSQPSETTAAWLTPGIVATTFSDDSPAPAPAPAPSFSSGGGGDYSGGGASGSWDSGSASSSSSSSDSGSSSSDCSSSSSSSSD